MAVTHIPPFPDDVPVAQLPELSLSRLRAADVQESEALFEACRASGFFLLDLRGDDAGEELLAEGEDLLGIARQLFALDLDEKQKHAYKPGGDIFGYKGHGAGTTDSKGTPDRNEMYNISQDDMLGLSSPLENPSVLTSNRHILGQYMRHAHSIVQLIFLHLDRQFDLPNGTFAARHRISEPSRSSLRMLKYAPQPLEDRRTSLLAHTDIGSVTLLFNAVGGLQILPPNAQNEDSNWQYVKPQPGCAVVNMGDAMVEFTGGVLRSNMHRVTYAPGAQSEVERYTVVYFSRPEKTVKMARLEESPVIPGPCIGEETFDMTAEEWEKQKLTALRNGSNPMRSRGGREPLAAS